MPEEILKTRLSGKKVIVRSNEDEPYRVGVFEGVTVLGNSRVPVFTDEKTGEKLLVMGAIAPYSTALIFALEGLCPRAQWDFIKEIFVFRDELVAMLEGELSSGK